MVKFWVREVQEFVVEAEDAEEAEALVRDGISHTPELVDATVSFEIPEREVELET